MCWCRPTPSWCWRARSCPPRGSPRARSASSRATAWASASARWCAPRHHPPRDAMFQDITVAHLDHMLLSTIPIEPTSIARCAPWCPRSRQCACRAVHLLRVDRAAHARPGQERHHGRTRCRSLHEAHRRHRPRRGRVRRIVRSTGRIATRSSPIATSPSSPTRAAPTSTPPPARTATPPVGVDATAKPSLAAYTPRHRCPPRCRSACVSRTST